MGDLKSKIRKILSSYLVLSKNEPTNKSLWERVLKLTKGELKTVTHNGVTVNAPNEGKGFKIYPSAYSNGWAAKTYKSLGGNWKKISKAKRDKGSDHGGLDAWFGKDTPWGNWVAITPVKKTITDDKGKSKTYLPGDIVGPCGISKSKDWKDVTKDGTQPLKCMAKNQALKYTREERAALAKNKMKKEKEQGKSTKVVKTPSFGDKAKKVIKKLKESKII
jgi:hypothetical protein